MKAYINSELLYQASKIVKSDYIEVLVKNREVKVMSTVADRKNIIENQIVIDSCYYGNEEDGAVMIPTRLIKLLDSKENIEVTDEIIKTNDKEIKFKSDIEIYEELKEYECLIFIKDFSKLSEIEYALAQDNCRPLLTCVYVNSNEIVALDGLRMAVTSFNEEITSKELLIPGSMIKMYKKIKNKKMVAISEDGNYLFMNFGNIKFIRRKKEDGKFVNYKSLFPLEENKKTHLRVDSAELYRICNNIKKASLYNSNLIKINLNKEKSYITSRDNLVEVKTYLQRYELEGNDIEIGVNPKNLSEALKRYDGIIDIYFDTPVSPIVLEDGKGKKDLILPIRIIQKDSNVIELYNN